MNEINEQVIKQHGLISENAELLLYEQMKYLAELSKKITSAAELAEVSKAMAEINHELHIF